MESYKLTIKKSAVRELKDIPQKDAHRVVKHIQTLAGNPRPYGSEKLSAQPYYRIRQGDYRIVYSVDDTNHIVDIIKIGHRREVYRL
jgi:mRNA interferase RelE/StbE